MSSNYSLISASAELARISDISAASYVKQFLDEDYVGLSAQLASAAYNLSVTANQLVVSARDSYNTFAQADIRTVTEYNNSAYNADISASYFKTVAYNADLSAVYFSGLVSTQKNITAADVSSAYRSDLSAANFAILATNAATSSDAWTYYVDASGAYQSAYGSYLHANAAYSLAYTYCYIDTSNSVARALQAYHDAYSAYVDASGAYTNAQNICNADAGTDISQTLNGLLGEISGYKTSAFSHSSNAWQYYVDASANQFSAAIAAYNDASMNKSNALLHANSAENSTAIAYNAYTSKLAAEAASAAADFYTPQPFTSILTQSAPQSYTASLPSLTATSFTTLNRYMIKYGTSYLTIDPSFNLVLTSGMDTYSDVLSKVFEAVLDPSDNLTSSSFRIDSDMDNIYSLDCSSSSAVLKFSNNWGQAANPTCGFLRFDYSYNRLVVKSRRRISTDISYTHTNDSSFTATNYYVCYDLGLSRFKLTQTLTSAATFTLYKSPIRADMPSAFNPYSIPYVPNARVSIANYVGPRRGSPPVGAKNTISDMDRNVKTNFMTKYRGQIDVSGWSVNTDISASAMLDTIFTAVQGQGNTIRYDKSVYKAFRTAALQTTLGCNSIADGTLGQNTVPYVYFTNDMSSNGVYHPFMVMASYSISDKPNRLLDVCRPPADGDALGYGAYDVTRDVTLQNYLVKIPMLDYGQVATDLTSANPNRNNMLSTLLSEIPDSSPDAAGINKASPTPYNYASNSAIGVAVDGVVIYPPSNNTLHPAQAQAEITNTGIHIGRGMGLHYHADGQSATPNNNMNLYNTNDYTNHRHPPLIGFGLDGIALYGQYDLSYNTMHGYGLTLDVFGGHTHGTYGYHYHAHTVDVSSNVNSNKTTLGMNTLSGVSAGTSTPQAYKLHVLMKGAWAGKINTVPEFWNLSNNAPSFTMGTNNSKFTGYGQSV